MKSLRTAYQKYRNGDSLTDEEIQDMLDAIEWAQEFLNMSPDFALARTRAIQDEIELKGFMTARTQRKNQQK